MATAKKKKTILIIGDLIWDHNLIQHPEAPSNHLEPMRHTVLSQEPGGAWYLKELIDIAMAGSDKDAQVIGPKRDRRIKSGTIFHINNAFMIWTPHERLKGDKEKVWRIWKFLGCQRPDSVRQPVPLTEDISNPSLLVIDDLALGFRNHKELWPEAMLKGRGPDQILVKTSLPPDNSPLWKELLKKKNADRLTVVMPVDVLRSRDADISQALSWDKTIEETVWEFENGASAEDLALCRRVIVHFGCGAGAASFSRCRQPYLKQKTLREKVQFERFVYNPENLEASCRARMPGQTYGATSLMTAAIARHILDSDTYPLFLALGRTLEAMRAVHELGAEVPGDDEKQGISTSRAKEEAGRILNYSQAENKPAAGDAATSYASAFPHKIFSNPVMKKQKARESDLLRDLTGAGYDYVAAKATDVVLRGPEKALKAVPKASYGKYLTVDREEIERINAIRNLISTYQANPEDGKPLSIAVFGPPGTGKSFAIKQLATEMFESSKWILEFNLSQLDSLQSLHEAFHQVRDATVKGRVPLVFWDEFDSAFEKQQLGWLKEFLAPMQDAEFRVGGLTHPFGKAIFVFAGGTRETFESFNRSGLSGEKGEKFRDAKGPDFVSRLRGYVNIKGPNPVSAKTQGVSNAKLSRTKILARQDPAHLIRRAIILRMALKRAYPHLIDSSSGMAAISTSVVRGFLRTDKFLYGARSMEAIVNMSSLEGANHFGVAHLPSDDLLKLHVSDDFMKHVKKGEMEVDLIEILAESCHTAWLEEKKKEFRNRLLKENRKKGRPDGEITDEEIRKKRPDLKPYAELDESGLENNRLTARLTQAKLLEIGYKIVRRSEGLKEKAMKKVIDDHRERLMEIEHDIWLQDRLLGGFEWTRGMGDEGLEKKLFLNRYIAPFNKVDGKGKQLDRVITAKIPETLWRHHFTLKKVKHVSQESL